MGCTCSAEAASDAAEVSAATRAPAALSASWSSSSAPRRNGGAADDVDAELAATLPTGRGRMTVSAARATVALRAVARPTPLRATVALRRSAANDAAADNMGAMVAEVGAARRKATAAATRGVSSPHPAQSESSPGASWHATLHSTSSLGSPRDTVRLRAVRHPGGASAGLRAGGIDAVDVAQVVPQFL
jgi:hypothetical protein